MSSSLKRWDEKPGTVTVKAEELAEGDVIVTKSLVQKGKWVGVVVTDVLQSLVTGKVEVRAVGDCRCIRTNKTYQVLDYAGVK